jgi:acylphosphatase
MTDPEPATHLITITGRVQGVGYRDWMVAQAATLGIAGWVRNRQEGSVEALVHGDAAAIEELLRRCQRGPHLAVVDAIVRQPGEVPSEPDFQRLPTA